MNPVEVVELFLDALNSQNVPDMMKLLTVDHTYYDSLGQPLQGVDALRPAWQGYFEIVPDYSIDLQECFCNGDRVVLFGVARGTLAVNGELLEENQWSTPIAVRVTVVEGQIAEWRIFADNEPIRALLRKANSG